MEEILHQLVDRLSHCFQGFRHTTWWFGISSISSLSICVFNNPSQDCVRIFAFPMLVTLRCCWTWPLFSYKSGANLPEVRTENVILASQMCPSLSKHSSWISQFQPLSLKKWWGTEKTTSYWCKKCFLGEGCWDILNTRSIQLLGYPYSLFILMKTSNPWFQEISNSIHWTDPWLWFPQNARSQFTLHGVRW